MTRPILATCNHCQNITTINYQTKKHKSGLIETYFKCMVCNHHYTCFVTDKKVREMQKKAKNLRMVSKFRDVTNELQSLQEKINERMERLKKSVKSW
jgi:phage terminase large subunit GpA-like protein